MLPYFEHPFGHFCRFFQSVAQLKHSSAVLFWACSGGSEIETAEKFLEPVASGHKSCARFAWHGPAPVGPKQGSVTIQHRVHTYTRLLRSTKYSNNSLNNLQQFILTQATEHQCPAEMLIWRIRLSSCFCFRDSRLNLWSSHDSGMCKSVPLALN